MVHSMRILPQHTTNENLTKNGGSSSQTFIYAQCSRFCFETDVRRTVEALLKVRASSEKFRRLVFSLNFLITKTALEDLLK
jgi:hypothetical protein